MAYLRKTIHSLGGGTPVGASPFQEALAYAQFMRAAQPRAMAQHGGDDDMIRLAIARMQQEGADRRADLQQQGYAAYRDAAAQRAEADRQLRMKQIESAAADRQANAERQAQQSQAAEEWRRLNFVTSQKNRADDIADRNAREGRARAERNERDEKKAYGEDQRKVFPGLAQTAKGQSKKVGEGNATPADAARAIVAAALQANSARGRLEAAQSADSAVLGIGNASRQPAPVDTGSADPGFMQLFTNPAVRSQFVSALMSGARQTELLRNLMSGGPNYAHAADSRLFGGGVPYLSDVQGEDFGQAELADMWKRMFSEVLRPEPNEETRRLLAEADARAQAGR